MLTSLQRTNNVHQFQLGNVTLPKNLVPLNLHADLNQISTPNLTPLNLDLDNHELNINARPHRVTASSSSTMNVDVVNPSNINADLINFSTMNPSTTNAETMNSSTTSAAVNISRSVPKISIFKKKSAPSVNSKNLETLFNKGDVLIECSNNFTHQECILYLKSNLMECKKALLDIKIREFRCKI